MLVQETNNSLQEISQRMTLSIPKVNIEAQSLAGEAAQLCAQVIDVKTKLICDEQHASHAVTGLIELDTIKKRLQETYKALQEVNNWTTLLMEVEEVFENNDIEQISIKLLSMQKSLEVLHLTSSNNEEQHSDKVQLLEGFKNRYEKIVEPFLNEAFLNQNSNSIEHYSKVFKEFHRSHKLVSFYRSCLRHQLLKEWSTQIEIESDKTLLNWLNYLYDRLNTIWKTQMHFCMKVLYPDEFIMSLKVLCDIYLDIVTSLDPSIEQCCNGFVKEISSHLDKQNALIELKHITNQFIRSIEQNIAAQLEPSPISSLSKSFFEEHQLTSLDNLIRTVYRPFVTFNQLYLQLEKDRLSNELTQMKAECTGVMMCSEYIIKSFTLARNSLKLYSKFLETHPIQLVDNVLQDFFLQFLFHIRSILHESLRASNQQSSNAENLSISSPSSSIISPNWNLIQQTLFAFQIIGEFLLQLENFQQQVLINLQENEKMLAQHGSSYFYRFDIFILNLDQDEELKSKVNDFSQSPNTEKKCPSCLNKVYDESEKFAKTIAKAICEAIMSYVQAYLANLFTSVRQQMEAEAKGLTSEVDSGTSPHEYITQIGQYLLTLPQHLEPFNPTDNAAIGAALQHSAQVFICDSSEPLDYTDMLLDSVLQQTTLSCIDNVLKLTKLSSQNGDDQGRQKMSGFTRKQLGVDLSYLSAVFEDLGLNNEKIFTLFVYIFNQVHSKQDFETLLVENPHFSNKLNALGEMIDFENV